MFAKLVDGASVVNNGGLMIKKFFIFPIVAIVFCLMVLLMWNFPASAAQFTDTEHWAKNYINYSVSKGYLIGVNSNKFAPNDGLTRGMAVAALYRYSGDKESFEYHFNDVTSDKYYSEAVSWGYKNNIVFGCSNNFYPNKYITREDIATIICRYLKAGTSKYNINFTDKNNISDYALPAVSYLTNKGIIKGCSDGSFQPKRAITRAELCVILARMDGKSFDIYKVPQKTVANPPKTETKVEKREYLGTYRLTCYCSGCNSPRGSRATASGALAKKGEYGTVAVSPSLYRNLGKNTVIYIEGVGYRKIQDTHGNSSNVIDVYVGEGGCRCSYNSISGKSAKVYIVK